MYVALYIFNFLNFYCSGCSTFWPFCYMCSSDTLNMLRPYWQAKYIEQRSEIIFLMWLCHHIHSLLNSGMRYFLGYLLLISFKMPFLISKLLLKQIILCLCVTMKSCKEMGSKVSKFTSCSHSIFSSLFEEKMIIMSTICWWMDKNNFKISC